MLTYRPSIAILEALVPVSVTELLSVTTVFAFAYGRTPRPLVLTSTVEERLLSDESETSLTVL
ncbi:hypothetical protein SDC9_79476 [bioreactor metagenome]|uniref:Uncharacterized protein n=1 Tax=bioreactor metagenome TaxID=1076179 RepID=A0A644YX75_9ZZZZ